MPSLTSSALTLTVNGAQVTVPSGATVAVADGGRRSGVSDVGEWGTARATLRNGNLFRVPSNDQ